MFYVYILRSFKNKDIYIGYSSDLKERIKYHNSGNVRATKDNLPWELIYYEAYKGKFDATKREKQLKNHRAKEDLKLQLKNSLK
jgi:putative endonuclease